MTPLEKQLAILLRGWLSDYLAEHGTYRNCPPLVTMTIDTLNFYEQASAKVEPETR